MQKKIWEKEEISKNRKKFMKYFDRKSCLVFLKKKT